MTSESLPSGSAPPRRMFVATVGVTGLAALLTACGGSDSKASPSSSSSPDNSTAGASGHDSGAAGSGGKVLAKTSEIPEGGGKIFADQGVVVTQPSKGQFKAFSSKCTHQGCQVTSIDNGVIVCPCHHSEFSVTDGGVETGPAPEPLPAANITVDGDSIKLA